MRLRNRIIRLEGAAAPEGRVTVVYLNRPDGSPIDQVSETAARPNDILIEIEYVKDSRSDYRAE